MKRIALLVTIMLFSASLSARTPRTPLPRQQSSSEESSSLTRAEIAELINACGVRAASMLARIFDYTYTHTSTFRERDGRGRVTRERISVLEAYPVRGRRFAYVAVSMNGKPVSRERIERARERAGRELERDEERIANAQNRRDATPGEQPQSQVTRHFGIFYDRKIGLTEKRFSINPIDFFQTHGFYAARRTTFNNRAAIVLNFRPHADAITTDMSSRLRARLGGRLWIDAVDKTPMRLEALPVGELNDVNVSSATALNADAPVVFEWMRLPNGTWMPSLNLINTYGREAIFEDIKFDFSYRLSDFRLFSTNIERVDINPPRE